MKCESASVTDRSPAGPATGPAHFGAFLAWLAWSGLAWFSKHPTGSSLLPVALVHLLGWIVLWRANQVWRRLDGRLESWFPGFLGWGIAFRFSAWLGVPLLDDDYARYLWDGWRMLVTGNPYEYPPIHFFGDPTVPATLQGVLDLVNHPHVPTLYGPGLQYWFGAAAWLGVGSLPVLKLLLVLADLGIVTLVRHLGGPRAALLYAWCPLVIFETAFNSHAEVLAILPLLAGIALHRSRNRFVSGLLLGMSAASKLTVLPAIPFVLRIRNAPGWAGFVVGAVVPYLPFGLLPSQADRAGLSEFLASWEFNSSIVGMLGLFLPATGSRWVALALVAPLLWVLWRRKSQEIHAIPRLDLVFGVWFLGSAVVNPWYLLWMVPFAAIFPTRMIWAALVMVTLSYATSMNLGLSLAGPYNHPWWVRPVEYGAVLFAWLWSWKQATTHPSAQGNAPLRTTG